MLNLTLESAILFQLSEAVTTLLSWWGFFKDHTNSGRDRSLIKSGNSKLVIFVLSNIVMAH